MPNGVCGRCGRVFANALQLGAHVRLCREQLRGARGGADNNIIAVPVAAGPPQITLHSLARREPFPWGREIRVQHERPGAGAISPYIRDYQPVIV